MTRHTTRKRTLDASGHVTPSEAGRILGLTPAAVIRLANVGQLPVTAWTSHGRIFDRAAVEALRDQRAAAAIEKLTRDVDRVATAVDAAATKLRKPEPPAA